MEAALEGSFCFFDKSTKSLIEEWKPVVISKLFRYDIRKQQEVHTMDSVKLQALRTIDGIAREQVLPATC